ncbi:ABC transporter permease [bacterium]|nr:MAG: ABC transporter permease [bacterium]
MVQDASALSASPVAPSARSKRALSDKAARNIESLLKSSAFFALSILLMLAFWMLLCSTLAKDLPTPLITFKALWAMLAHPFYKNDDGTMGVGNLVIASLGRVFMGFGVASIIAIPLGILVGSVPTIKRIVDPIASLMRPVSPLAWFPLSQVVFRSMGDNTTPMAIIATIAVCSLWPTLMNTAFGVSNLPEDYKTVSRVFQFSTTRYLTKVLLPYSLPHILTGLRLSIGIAWLVIVAAEMLSGSSGIGFSAYDAYNNGRLDEMVATIIVIGGVGLVIDRIFDFLQNKFSYESK